MRAPARPEHCFLVAAVGAHVRAHVLHDAQDRNIHLLLEHLEEAKTQVKAGRATGLPSFGLRMRPGLKRDHSDPWANWEAPRRILVSSSTRTSETIACKTPPPPGLPGNFTAGVQPAVFLTWGGSDVTRLPMAPRALCTNELEVSPSNFPIVSLKHLELP